MTAAQPTPIVAGTLITLLFAPALYCAVFGLHPPRPEPESEPEPEPAAEA